MVPCDKLLAILQRNPQQLKQFFLARGLALSDCHIFFTERFSAYLAPSANPTDDNTIKSQARTLKIKLHPQRKNQTSLTLRICWPYLIPFDNLDNFMSLLPTWTKQLELTKDDLGLLLYFLKEKHPQKDLRPFEPTLEGIFKISLKSVNSSLAWLRELICHSFESWLSLLLKPKDSYQQVIQTYLYSYWRPSLKVEVGLAVDSSQTGIIFAKSYLQLMDYLLIEDQLNTSLRILLLCKCISLVQLVEDENCKSLIKKYGSKRLMVLAFAQRFRWATIVICFLEARPQFIEEVPAQQIEVMRTLMGKYGLGLEFRQQILRLGDDRFCLGPKRKAYQPIFSIKRQLKSQQDQRISCWLQCIQTSLARHDYFSAYLYLQDVRRLLNTDGTKLSHLADHIHKLLTTVANEPKKDSFVLPKILRNEIYSQCLTELSSSSIVKLEPKHSLLPLLLNGVDSCQFSQSKIDKAISCQKTTASLVQLFLLKISRNEEVLRYNSENGSFQVRLCAVVDILEDPLCRVIKKLLLLEIPSLTRQLAAGVFYAVFASPKQQAKRQLDVILKSYLWERESEFASFLLSFDEVFPAWEMVEEAERTRGGGEPTQSVQTSALYFDFLRKKCLFDPTVGISFARIHYNANRLKHSAFYFECAGYRLSRNVSEGMNDQHQALLEQSKNSLALIYKELSTKYANMMQRERVVGYKSLTEEFRALSRLRIVNKSGFKKMDSLKQNALFLRNSFFQKTNIEALASRLISNEAIMETMTEVRVRKALISDGKIEPQWLLQIGNIERRMQYLDTVLKIREKDVRVQQLKFRALIELGAHQRVIDEILRSHQKDRRQPPILQEITEPELHVLISCYSALEDHLMVALMANRFKEQNKPDSSFQYIFASLQSRCKYCLHENLQKTMEQFCTLANNLKSRNGLQAINHMLAILRQLFHQRDFVLPETKRKLLHALWTLMSLCDDSKAAQSDTASQSFSTRPNCNTGERFWLQVKKQIMLYLLRFAVEKFQVGRDGCPELKKIRDNIQNENLWNLAEPHVEYLLGRFHKEPYKFQFIESLLTGIILWNPLGNVWILASMLNHTYSRDKDRGYFNPDWDRQIKELGIRIKIKLQQTGSYPSRECEWIADLTSLETESDFKKFQLKRIPKGLKLPFMSHKQALVIEKTLEVKAVGLGKSAPTRILLQCKANDSSRVNVAVLRKYNVVRDQLNFRAEANMTHFFKELDLLDEGVTYSVLNLSKFTLLIEAVPHQSSLKSISEKESDISRLERFEDFLKRETKNTKKVGPHFNSRSMEALKFGLAEQMLKKGNTVEEWWRYFNNYCRTTAQWSFLGFVVGLGDRHGDNILLTHDMKMVHIDFEYGLDYGLALGVPEWVPFRMVKSMVQALGVLGTDGLFMAQMLQVASQVKLHEKSIWRALCRFNEKTTPAMCEKIMARALMKSYGGNISQGCRKLTTMSTSPLLLREMFIGWGAYY